MDLYFDLNLVQSQKVLLTPQLKQAFEILKMSSQELFEYVEEQLEANPALEVMDSIGIDSCENCLDIDELLNWEYDFNSKLNLRAQLYEDSDDDNSEYTLSPDEKLSLKEHLLFQLHTSGLTESQICIGEYLIDNVDENGYLYVELSEVAEFFNVNTRKVAKVLDYIQTFDPPGICARSLKECLSIQLNQINCVDKDAYVIIGDYLDELAEERLDLIAKKMGLPLQRVEEVLKLLKTLEPKPGREYSNNSYEKYIIPDIIIRNNDGKYEAVVNEDAVPLLNINKYYSKILKADVGNEVKKFINNRIDSALWILKCIEHRKSFINKAAEYILSEQHDFFEKGKKFLKHVSIKSLSDEIGIHESMAEEIFKGKYIQCHWGVFEMKYFVS